ncbi:YkgJ family cysteine cluster protein [Halomonas sp. DP8Y7-1]|uniref:YkgJ family cysteine cluster protein n=1 Tax=Halomonas sp. DP8Y7-1 TaxID=2859078 RepID=UPI001C95F825|nr:YkgJ family cysteine cluster protein [Halomonas sp. DP8Y7-1]MBY6030380.1 YkgJ family cysteine cluster protein [Halomonas sp. DP8Y7-1]
MRSTDKLIAVAAAASPATEAQASGHLDCRPGCGACCIAPSISSPIPGMPEGKPAGVRCVQLDSDHLCKLFGSPERPAVCARFDFDADLCGTHRDEALERITALEQMT